MDWQSYSVKYENELLNSVIPFWEKNCVDKEFGGYYTSLDRDGSVYDTMKYMWMQWRIVYMFAEIYLAGYKKDSYIDIAEKGFDYIKQNFQYSILENYNARVDDRVILDRESWWKETLQSRTFGYNDN